MENRRKLSIVHHLRQKDVGPLQRSILDGALGTMADIVQSDGFSLDGKKEAVDAPAAAVEHLPEGDSELFRFILGDGVPLR